MLFNVASLERTKTTEMSFFFSEKKSETPQIKSPKHKKKSET